MTPSELIAELRDLADQPERLRARIAELPPARMASLLFEFVVIEARGDAPASVTTSELPRATPDTLATTLDYAKSLSDAIEGIETLDGVLAAAFEGISDGEAHLLAAERGIRALVERRRTET